MGLEAEEKAQAQTEEPGSSSCCHSLVLVFYLRSVGLEEVVRWLSWPCLCIALVTCLSVFTEPADDGAELGTLLRCCCKRVGLGRMRRAIGGHPLSEMVV